MRIKKKLLPLSLFLFYYVPNSHGQTPHITSVYPSSAPVGGSVQISGTNFAIGSVTFSGVKATVTRWGSTYVTTTVPLGATTGNVVVTTPSGIHSNGFGFTVTPPPTIASINPTTGTYGTQVTLSGSNFGTQQTSASTVLVNGVNAPTVSWSNASVAFLVPAGTTNGNTTTVQVILNADGVLSNALNFTIIPPPPPTITSISPASGLDNTSITINGMHFTPIQSLGVVRFGNGSMRALSYTDTKIVASLTGPSYPNPGTYPITVQASGFTSNGVSYTLLPSTNILIGSSPGAGSTGTFERYDDTGKLVQNGNLSVARSLHSATLLQNGTIFLAGGIPDTTSWQIIDQNGNVLGSGFLQDPRFSHVATLLFDGNVFLAGGAGAPGTWEIHSPTGTLVASGGLQDARGSGAQGLTLANGNVWISSGSAVGGSSCTYEIHDENGNLVSSSGTSTCFEGGTIQALYNGNVMLLGGDIAPGAYEVRSQTGAFVSTGSLTNAFNHGANSVLLNNGNVFIFGSCIYGGAPPDYRDPAQKNANPNDLTFACGTFGSTSSWEIRDVNGNFVATGTLQNQYDGGGAAVLSTGNVFITGGNLCAGCWEIRSPAGALVSQGSLFDSRGGGHTLTNVFP